MADFAEDVVIQLESLTRRLTRLESQRPAWINWTPTITQSVSVTATINQARYTIIGNTVHVYAEVTATSAGTAGNAITIGGFPSVITPFTFYVADISPLGTASVLDQGVGTYAGMLVALSDTAWHLWSPATNNNIGANPSFALANTDIIVWNATYELA